jgi:hypothetical protein
MIKLRKCKKNWNSRFLHFRGSSRPNDFLNGHKNRELGVRVRCFNVEKADKIKNELAVAVPPLVRFSLPN